jgi:beta-lactamase superfamily II metal-dependent hydrolase
MLAMATIIHIIDIGQGNMVLIQTASGRNFVFDCNITEANKSRVLAYVSKQIGAGSALRAFICSHRDADHMRGVDKLDARFPVHSVWDSGYPGTSTSTPEYQAYMRLRRRVGAVEKKKLTKQDFGRTRFRYMSAQDSRLPRNANAQGIVIKVEHRSASGGSTLGSVMLPGDSDAAAWKKGIMLDYASADLSSSLLMGGHHGSISFFDDPSDEKHYYTRHILSIKPDMSLISVGPNSHGHPDSEALKLYKKYSAGSEKGNKVYRTDKQGTMKITLKDAGGCNLKVNQ